MNNALMTPRKNKRSEASKVIAQAIIDQYKPTSTSFIRNQLRNSFSFPNYITPISVYQRHTYTPPQNMIYIFQHNTLCTDSINLFSYKYISITKNTVQYFLYSIVNYIIQLKNSPTHQALSRCCPKTPTAIHKYNIPYGQNLYKFYQELLIKFCNCLRCERCWVPKI